MVSISFNKISKSFRYGRKRVRVVTDLSLEIHQNEIFGFLGPNGAGKSTSIKMLLNFIKPDTGHISINGLSVKKENFQKHIGFLPETPCFYENLTGMETLRFAGKASGIDNAAIKDKSIAVLNRLNLEKAGDHRINTYSKGMKQRLGIALSLIHDPDIFILDEPMSGLDPMGRRLITDVILELKQKGKTVFFSSHILSDIERLCDRVGILNKGRLLHCGSVSEIAQNHAGMEEAFISFIEADNRIHHG